MMIGAIMLIPAQICECKLYTPPYITNLQANGFEINMQTSVKKSNPPLNTDFHSAEIYIWKFNNKE